MGIGHDSLTLDDKPRAIAVHQGTSLPGLKEILLLKGDMDFNDGLPKIPESCETKAGKRRDQAAGHDGQDNPVKKSRGHLHGRENIEAEG
jgi:hypothetical protein